MSEFTDERTETVIVAANGDVYAQLSMLGTADALDFSASGEILWADDPDRPIPYHVTRLGHAIAQADRR